MRITLPYLVQQFDRFNSLCFNGELKRPMLKIGHARTTAGQLRFKWRTLPHGVRQKYDYVLCISDAYDYPEEQLQDVIIHEMIHYYIDIKGLTDTSPHGDLFCQIMNAINARHGRHITVSVKKTEGMRQDDMQSPRVSVVCVSTLADGRKGVTVVARTRIRQFNTELPRCYSIQKLEWYFTIDPFFRTIRTSLTPKIYLVDQELLATHLQTASRLVITPYDIHIEG